MDKYLIQSPSTSRAKPGKRQRPETTPPLKQKKKFFANPKEVRNAADQTLPTQNRFGDLTIDDDDSDAPDVSEPFRNATKKKPVNNTPPIIIELNGDWTHQKIKDTLEKYTKDFFMKYRGRNIVRVQCYSPKTHQVLKEGLRNESVTFHTYTRKDEKLPKAVIKGLPKFLHSGLSEELASLGFPEVTVTEMKTFYPTECPPVLIQFQSGTNMVRVKQIRYLSNCSIDVERYKPTKKPGTQCFRCQGFGHASRNCNRAPRCVKCAEAHPTWECPKTTRDTPARCCNCQEEHPANFAKCAERIKYVERIESKRITLQKSITASDSQRLEKAPETWAQIVKSDVSSKTGSLTHTQPAVFEARNPITNKVPPLRLVDPTEQSSSTSRKAEPRRPRKEASAEKNTHDPETVEMLQILTTLQSIKEEFIMCKTFMEKVILILSHLGHYV